MLLLKKSGIEIFKRCGTSLNMPGETQIILSLVKPHIFSELFVGLSIPIILSFALKNLLVKIESLPKSCCSVIYLKTPFIVV